MNSRFFDAKRILISAVAMTITLASCSNTDPMLIPRPPDNTGKKVKSSTDSIMTNMSPSVDILFVVDDSPSMDTHQDRLVANLDKFIDAFSKSRVIDYHIGVITTSTSKGGILVGNPKFITPSTPDGLKILKSNLIVGTSGDAEEMMFFPAYLALSEASQAWANKDFYRKDAYLAVIFITDAEDQSSISPLYFADFLYQLKKGYPERVLTYAVVIPSNDRTGCKRDSSGPPIRTEEYLRLTGGSEFGLCDPDYGEKLAGIGSDLFTKVMNIVYLDRAPVLSTVKVRFGTQEIPSDSTKGWTYDPARVALIFSANMEWSEQPAGTKLSIEFTAVENYSDAPANGQR